MATAAKPAGVKLSDVEFSEALIVPPSGEPVEVMFVLRPASERQGGDLAQRHEFIITSHSVGDASVEHCRGFISALSPDVVPPRALLFGSECYGLSSIAPELMYEMFDKAGNQYTGCFRGVSQASCGSGYCRATADEFKTRDESLSALPFSCMYPALLNSCLQSTFPTTMGEGSSPKTMMPIGIKEITLLAHGQGTQVDHLNVTCRTDKFGPSKYRAHIDAVAGGRTLVSITSLMMKVIGAPPARENETVGQCQKFIMTLDPDLVDAQQAKDMCRSKLPQGAPRNLDLFTKARRFFAMDFLSQIKEPEVQSMRPYLREYLKWLEKLAIGKNMIPLMKEMLRWML